MRRTRSTSARRKLKRKGVFGWLRDVAGHATTETVIMIPVFVAIWGGIWYTHGRYRKAIHTAQFTRAHVWAHAYTGCEGSPSGAGTDIGARSEDHSGAIDGITSLLFGSGIIPGFQFDEIEGERTTSIEKPTVLGEGSASMAYNLVVLCNEQTSEDVGFWDAARDMFF